MTPLSLPGAEEYLSIDALSIDANCAKSGTPPELSDFPDEILEQVFLEHVLRDKDLYAVALVNRRCSRLIRKSLYIEVDLLWRSDEYMCFGRTLSDCPELGSLVRKVELRAESDAEYDSFNSEVRQILQIMPALRVLYLPGGFKCSGNLTNLFLRPMSHLHSLSFGIDGELSSMHLVTEALSIAHLKYLRIWYDTEFKHSTRSNE
jgi:hypothetical protein